MFGTQCALVLLVILIMGGCTSERLVVRYKTPEKTVEEKIVFKSECEALRLLTNRQYIDSVKNISAVMKILSALFERAGMSSHKTCDYGGCFYDNLSLEKSIYKIDVLRLMRYYKCSDSTELKTLTRGKFSYSDMERINTLPPFKTYIDTTILY